MDNCGSRTVHYGDLMDCKDRNWPRCDLTRIYYRPQRSCEGYVFIRVCDSVYRGGAIPACIAGGIPACLAAGGVCSRGSAPGGACSGGVCSGGCGDPPPKADGYCCGRYASYWNAFLFHQFIRSSAVAHSGFFSTSKNFICLTIFFAMCFW